MNGEEDVEPDADAEVDAKKEVDISNMEVIPSSAGYSMPNPTQNHGLQDRKFLKISKL